VVHPGIALTAYRFEPRTHSVWRSGIDPEGRALEDLG